MIPDRRRSCFPSHAPESLRDYNLDQERRPGRALLKRLSQREDVTDDFWRSVGQRRPEFDVYTSIDQSQDAQPSDPSAIDQYPLRHPERIEILHRSARNYLEL